MLKSKLASCREALSSYIHHTPVLTSSYINELVGGEVLFKCENFQRTGSFKIRGATNAIMQLSDEQKARGVVAHSSGNFAQALALASRNLGVRCFIIMPSTGSLVKKEATRGYGAGLVECEPNMESRERTAAGIVERTGAKFIHPSNHMDVIMGQSTAAQEFLGDYPGLENLITPVGGGGLISGTALAAGEFGNNCKVYGGEPSEADDAFRSLQSGCIETNLTTNTMAEGLLTNLGDLTFPIIQKHVEQITLITEEEIVEAMKIIWSRMKIVIEPSSAVAVATLLKEKEIFRDKKTGVIVSGGNVDLEHLPF